MYNKHSLFDELSKFSGSGVESRAENSFTVAVQFFSLLEKQVDERAYDLMMKAWFRAVKDNDFGKFKRTYRKYISDQDQSKPT